MSFVLAISIALCITFVALTGLVLTLIGLPGNWLLVLTTILVYVGVDSESIGWMPKWSLYFMVGLALVGEAIEFAAGALGVGKRGGSKRSAALAILGSMIGAICGMFVGLPIPVLGSLIATVLLGGVGACVGAILGERWIGKDWDGSMQVGFAAFWGKLFGTLGKTLCGAIMTVVVIILAWTY